MKRFLLLFLAIFFLNSIQAQPRIRDKKYPSLLWEITGKGMKKPSYLIGTMHVSSKLAFHLPDSFYHAIRQSDVVALETNPETWQEDMSKYDLESYGYSAENFIGIPNDYFTINTLKFFKYDSKIERSLYSNPSTINNLLYRSYGNESSDFEEDTYLDMYIFQCGKKWGKKVAGVEDYGESMKLMEQAYKDAAKDKNKKERSYDDMDEGYSLEKLQEAYRKGDLDLLDSINRYNSFSQAFDEKFLFRRNEIQADNIDSIMRAGSVLFVGVGAAHLPGDRGVIELLRRKGYKLRPIKMGERAGRDKDVVDKIRVPVQFRTESSEDGFLKVDIPGKFYKFGEDAALDQRQYADMANGSYYMVTRIMTNAWMWSHNAEDVYRTIDSLLYENVPGKILTKTNITRNGYKGFDITNRTRRGDMQRYNIFITPFEILFFKMSGNGDYVKNGDEAKKFFGSILLKEYKNGTEPTTSWKKYTPPYGGFSVDLPHEPYIGNDGSWIYDSEDKAAGTYYRIIRSDIHNYFFVEEDSFDLSLMDESFMASAFIDSQVSRKQNSFRGYPALDVQYRDKRGATYLVRFLIQGAHYYTLVARGKQVTPAMKNFIESFEITPFVYPPAKEDKDTMLYFSVQSHLRPEEKKIKLDIPDYSYYGRDEEEESEDDLLESGTFRNRIFKNDSTGERIYVSFYRAGRYDYTEDSSALDNDRLSTIGTDTTNIIRYRKKYEMPNGIRVWETISSDTGSSRTLWGKTFYKNGIGFTIATQSDTLSAPSAFVKSFFDTFSPVDTLKGINPFERKSKLFFEDFMSSDSVLHKRAVKHIDDIDLDSADLVPLKKAISSVNWSEKKYLDTKASLINKLGDIKTKESALYLKDLYYGLDDTIQLQYAVLESLLQHKTQNAFFIFRDIINNEPPVLALGKTSYSSMPDIPQIYSGNYDDGNFLDELSDTLKLTKQILPDLLPLLNLDDYKSSMMALLGEMVDSNLVSPRDYEMYFSKFLIEAKQELKKQSIAEKKKAIEKAEEDKEEGKTVTYDFLDDDKDYGNDDLSLYATLLLPYWETNPQVKTLLGQMLKSNDKRLKYNTMLLMIKNNKPYPDTLLNYFGDLDEYRYELYTDLKEIKKKSLFPSRYNNHLDLGRSSLLEKKSYGKPDSLIYLDRLATEYKGRKGYIYFYKVKAKKDDLTWKIAMVGLVPDNPKEFEYDDKSPVQTPSSDMWFPGYTYYQYSFTRFTDTRLHVDEELLPQLKKELKKALYSRRKSAAQFYEAEEDRTTTEAYED